MATWELAADKREGSGDPEDAEAGVVLLSSGVRQGRGGGGSYTLRTCARTWRWWLGKGYEPGRQGHW